MLAWRGLLDSPRSAGEPCFHALPCVLQVPAVPRALSCPVHCSMPFAPSEFLRSPPAPCLSALRLHCQGFGPRRDPIELVHVRECFQVLARFRPQVLSTSRRLSPCSTPRACFIPQPRSGLLVVQGFLSACSGSPSSREPAPLPLVRDHSPDESDAHDRATSTSRLCSTRGRVRPRR